MSGPHAPSIPAIAEDATVALAAARLWLVGEYADLPRSEFNAEAWQALVDRVGPLLAGVPGWMHTARTFRRPTGIVDALVTKREAERQALQAGTHEIAVDDFGNEYLARNGGRSA